jgi:hypothetical protein
MENSGMSNSNKIPENIQKWINALRSGDYNQQEKTLKGPDGYCCLGVYCSIMGKEPYETSEEDLMDEIPGYEGTKELYDYCNSNIDPDVVDYGISMNDEGKTFWEIADMIEEFYETGSYKGG